MHKEQFMQGLTKGLAGLDQKSRTDILADFAEHFLVGSSLGKTEAQICAELGDPLQIAGGFLPAAGDRFTVNWLALTGALLFNLLLALPIWLSLLALWLSFWLLDLALVLLVPVTFINAFMQKASAVLILLLLSLALLAFAFLLTVFLLYLSKWLFYGFKSYMSWQKRLIISRKKNI